MCLSVLQQLPMPVPNTETGLVTYPLEIKKFKIKFEITVCFVCLSVNLPSHPTSLFEERKIKFE